MNCKPGDLAVICFPAYSENLGRLVSCIRLLVDTEPVDGIIWEQNVSGPVWLVEAIGSPLKWNSAGNVIRRAINDVCLRPIRDPGEDAKDETLSWLDVPQKNKQVIK